MRDDEFDHDSEYEEGLGDDFEKEYGEEDDEEREKDVAQPKKPHLRLVRSETSPKWLKDMAQKHGGKLDDVEAKVDELMRNGEEFEESEEDREQRRLRVLIEMGELELAVEKNGNREELMECVRKHLGGRRHYPGQNLVMFVLEGFYGMAKKKSKASRHAALVLKMLEEGMPPTKFGAYISKAGGMGRALKQGSEDGGPDRPRPKSRSSRSGQKSRRGYLVTDGQLRKLAKAAVHNQSLPLRGGAFGTSSVRKSDGWRHVTFFMHIPPSKKRRQQK